MTLLIENISKNFITKHKNTHTLDNINLLVQKGEFVCILGPSGCGKSTLLNIIAGLEKADYGKVYLNGVEVISAGPDRAVMFQESALFPWLRVIDNVEFGMKIADIPNTERRQRALKYLQMVHLTKFQNSYVHELSGGMKQRVALARALTLDSEVLLMDEPFASLDDQTKNLLQLELQKIWLETNKTVFFITHNVEEAVFLADRIFIMSANPGRIKRSLEIKLPRPRKPENDDFCCIIKEIKNELNEEVRKVAEAEYDTDWIYQ